MEVGHEGKEVWIDVRKSWREKLGHEDLDVKVEAGLASSGTEVWMDVKVVAEQKLVALRATEVVGMGWPKGRQSAEVGRTNNNRTSQPTKRKGTGLSNQTRKI